MSSDFLCINNPRIFLCFSWNTWQTNNDARKNVITHFCENERKDVSLNRAKLARNTSIKVFIWTKITMTNFIVFFKDRTIHEELRNIIGYGAKKRIRVVYVFYSTDNVWTFVWHRYTITRNRLPAHYIRRYLLALVYAVIIATVIIFTDFFFRWKRVDVKYVSRRHNLRIDNKKKIKSSNRKL